MRKLVLIRIVRSDDQSFILGTGTWKILSKGLEGIDFPNISVYSDKNGAGDGALLSGKRIDDRDIQIKCKNTDPKSNEQVRAAAINFFNPKYSYSIYITYMGQTRWTEGELQGFSCPSENIHRCMTMIVKFYCRDGVLKSVDNFGKDIASVSPGFGFPFIDVKNPLIPVYASIFNYNQEVVLTNDGATDTYPRITINIKGNVSNPKVYKDSHYVRILGDFVKGDVLSIDCEKCTIYKNGVNWIQHIDRSSTFTDMALPVGDSKIGFVADDGDTNMSVFIYFNKLYTGL